MESIEQLQQDNAKLQERLNNAAKFFREQKAQIESLTNEVKEKTELALDYRNQIKSLTEENEELKHNAEVFNSLQKSYENTIQSKDKAYEILQNTYNEVFAENGELKRKLKDDSVSPEKWNDLVTEKESLNKQLNEYELTLQTLEGDYKDLKKVYEDEQSEYENKITLLEEDNIKLSKDNDDYKKYIETLKEDANKLKENNDNFEKEYKSLEIINDDLNKQIDRLEAKVNELLASEAKLSSDNDILRKSDKNFREAYAKEKEENTALNTALGEAEEQYDKLMIQCEKYNKFISVIIATAEEYNYINTQHNDQKATVNKNNQNNTDNVFMKDAPEFTI